MDEYIGVKKTHINPLILTFDPNFQLDIQVPSLKFNE